MSQMPSKSQSKTHYFGLSRSKKSKIDRGICRTTGIRLYIYMRNAEQFFCSILSDYLDLIDYAISLIISFFGIPFRILVGKNCSQCFYHCFRCIIFRSNHLQNVFLTHLFFFDETVNLRIDLL